MKFGGRWRQYGIGQYDEEESALSSPVFGPCAFVPFLVLDLFRQGSCLVIQACKGVIVSLTIPDYLRNASCGNLDKLGHAKSHP